MFPLQVASVEKWVGVMYSAVDATGVGQQPLHNANPSMRVLFVAWVIFGTFFISNLIIGVSIDKVGKSGEEKGNVFLCWLTWTACSADAMTTSSEQTSLMLHAPFNRTHLGTCVPGEYVSASMHFSIYKNLSNQSIFE